MPKQQVLSMRPGTILGYKGRAWRVISNDTFVNRFTCQSMEGPSETKTFRYKPGDEITVRWIPHRSPHIS